MVSVLEMAVLLLCIAVSGIHVLQPVLDYLLAISASNPVVWVAAGAVTPLALCVAYFTGVILLYLQITPPAPPALVPSPVALRLFAAMVCVLLLLLAIMPLLPWL